MTIGSDHDGLDRRDRFLVLQARLGDLATVVRRGPQMHLLKPGYIPGQGRPGAPAAGPALAVSGCVHAPAGGTSGP
jgi:hypothetical protein